jgi:hypothetical protein
VYIDPGNPVRHAVAKLTYFLRVRRDENVDALPWTWNGEYAEYVTPALPDRERVYRWEFVNFTEHEVNDVIRLAGAKTVESFYVKRTRVGDDRVGWTGPIGSKEQAGRERDAWQSDGGWTAEIFPLTPEVLAEVRRWDGQRRGDNRRRSAYGRE